MTEKIVEILDKGKLLDWVIKGLTVLLTVAIVPIGGWVWQTSIALHDLERDFEAAEKTIVSLETSQKEQAKAERTTAESILRLQIAMDHVRLTVDRIEKKLGE